MSYNRPDLQYIPQEVLNDNILSDGITPVPSLDPIQEASEDVVSRLLDHLSVIQEYRKRLDTIDYLVKNAETLAGNIKYATDKQEITDAIKMMGGEGNTVDFNMFKQSIDIILENYNNMSIVALSGVKS